MLRLRLSPALTPSILALLALVCAPAARASCGAAFCAVNTSWDVQGVWDKPGLRLDLRAEFIDLNQLRDGTEKVAPAGEPGEHDERRTLNRNFSATLDWSFGPRWGLSARLPVTSRTHDHVHNDPDGAEAEGWDFAAPGDLEVVGRYAFFRDAATTLGVRAGLKLPTGTTDVRNEQSETAERSLQPGSGSLDTLLGFYGSHRTGRVLWFAQATWQQAVTVEDHFHPGYRLGFDAGANVAVDARLSLLLQLNVLHRGHDSGFNAEADRSGATQVFLSPGLSYRLLPSVQVYGFFQQPVHQAMDGVQLTADWSSAVGLSFQF